MEKKSSENLKNKLPWIIAIVLGVLSIFAVNKYLRLQEAGKESKLVYLISAASDLASGDVLSREDLKVELFPSESVSQISISVPGNTTKIGAEETERKLLLLIGRKTNRAIPEGEQIFWSDLVEPPKDRFPERIPPNMRAITIPVSQITSVSHLIEIGDRVDVIFTGDNELQETDKMLQLLTLNSLEKKEGGSAKKDAADPDGLEETEQTQVKRVQGSVVLLANVMVIAVGSQYRSQAGAPEDYSTVTLLVTPDEGVLITQAMNSGTLSLMLCSRSDIKGKGAMEITADNLLETSRKLNQVRNPEVKK